MPLRLGMCNSKEPKSPATSGLHWGLFRSINAYAMVPRINKYVEVIIETARRCCRVNTGP
jgi:hypothetical protein